jgi:hypothetical protein
MSEWNRDGYLVVLVLGSGQCGLGSAVPHHAGLRVLATSNKTSEKGSRGGAKADKIKRSGEFVKPRGEWEGKRGEGRSGVRQGEQEQAGWC